MNKKHLYDFKRLNEKAMKIYVNNYLNLFI